MNKKIIIAVIITSVVLIQMFTITLLWFFKSSPSCPEINCLEKIVQLAKSNEKTNQMIRDCEDQKKTPGIAITIDGRRLNIFCTDPIDQKK